MDRKYFFLTKRTAINGVEQDPSIGLLCLPADEVDKLVKEKRAVAIDPAEIGSS